MRSWRAVEEVGADLEFFEGAGGVVFDEGVGAFDESSEGFASVVGEEVDGDGVFVAEHLDEGGSVVPGSGSGRAVGVAGGPAGAGGDGGVGRAGDCAAGHGLPDVDVFDFDDFRAEVGEQGGGEGAGPDDGEVDDADAFERFASAHAITPR